MNRIISRSIQEGLAILCIYALFAWSGFANAGDVAISSSDNGPVSADKLTVVCGPDATVIITATCQNGYVSMSYTPSDGITQTSDDGSGTTQEVTKFTCDSSTLGKDNTITANVTHYAINDDDDPCLPDGKKLVFHVKIPKLEADQVSFSGDGNTRIKNVTDKYKTDTGDNIASPEWDSTATNQKAVCYKVQSKPTLKVKFKISPDLKELSYPVKIKATGTQQTTSTALNYDAKSLTLTSNTATLDGFTTSSTLSDKIDSGNFQLSYKVSYDGGTAYKDITTTTTNQILTTLDTPSGFPSYIRLNYWCGQATGKSTGADIADIVALGAVSMPFGYNYLVDSPDNVWELIDGTSGDCISQATLAQQSLALLGVNGATLAWIYPRHAAWTGIEQDKNDGYEKQGTNMLTYSTSPAALNHGVWSVSNWNKWEGCCKYNNKYWMGGEAGSKATPYEVITANAGNPPTPNQYWYGAWDTEVPYPAGTP